MSRVLVCGSRDYADADRLWSVLEAVHSLYDIDVIIEGGAAGADTLARLWGEETEGVEVETYPADWDGHGKAAGPIRNKQMLVEGKPDIVYAFVNRPLSESRGTHNMVMQARRAGIRTIVNGEDDTSWVRAGSKQ